MPHLFFVRGQGGPDPESRAAHVAPRVAGRQRVLIPLSGPHPLKARSHPSAVSRETNIFLIGPMGAGKSTVGRHLAAVTGKRFLDSDQEIERKTGAEIDLIFELEGEPGFRRRESRILEQLAGMQGIVLATGGGAVLEPDNRTLLKHEGIVVYLTAAPEVLARRTARDKKRPLLQTVDRLNRIRDLMNDREPIYRELADLVVDTGRCTVRRAVDQICRKLDEACGK